jgi:hypothetical protein
MSKHDTLKETALQAIRDIHSDSSVSLETTLDSLEELGEEISILQEAVRQDINFRDR